MRLLLVLLLLPFIGLGQNTPVISMYDKTNSIRFLHSDSFITEVPKASIAYVTASTNQSVSFGVKYGGTGLKQITVLASSLTSPVAANAAALLLIVNGWLNE